MHRKPLTRRAKIVATLGPATDGREQELVEAGLDVARLNFSHGSPDEHARRCQAVREAARRLNRPVAVLQDLQGPRLRVGRLEGGGPVVLRPGETVFLTGSEVIGSSQRIPCTYPWLARDLRPGNDVLLDDGRIRLSVQESVGADVRTVVTEGGVLAEHKGINLPDVQLSTPSFTTKDREDLTFGVRELDVDFVALSFVRRADDVLEAREALRELGSSAELIAKLEKREALDGLASILEASDGVMVARGDLGVELPPEDVPVIQKTAIRMANQHGVPVITATQMLESMVTAERPTRAEATDVANAVWDGTDAVMLSAETAVGEHPVKAVRMMDRIVRTAERAEPVRPAASFHDVGHGLTDSSPAVVGADQSAAAITHAACILAEDLGASAIVGVTVTGRTARLLSRQRPRVPILALTHDERAARRLAVCWGIRGVASPVVPSLDIAEEGITAFLLDAGLIDPGDTVVVTGVHPFRTDVATNFVTYHRAAAQP